QMLASSQLFAWALLRRPLQCRLGAETWQTDFTASPCQILADGHIAARAVQHKLLRIHQRVSLRLRASFTNFVNLRASSSTRCSCLNCTSSFGINSAPMPSAAAPARTKLKAVCWFTPPDA